MPNIRQPAVADLFYPGEPARLASTVAAYLSDAPPPAADAGDTRAIIAPHAGYVYSGAVAGRVYGQLWSLAGHLKRVVLIGPCHRMPLRGMAIPSVDAFATPLGPLAIDVTARTALADVAEVAVTDAPHAEEHSLEVHLPFLQTVFGDVAIVPLVVGQCAVAVVDAVIERLADGGGTLIVVSSDLSHYLPYAEARATDERTRRAIEALDPAAIASDQACGRTAVNALLTFARRHRLRARTVDLRTSGDTAGDRRAVVGYGAWLFTAPPAESPPRDVVA